ncbi:hypothetical protein TRVL_03740 [Trypanosoma vivax]|uniref:Uncharacterized protein n=1 Tax=Trypanosoma vivax (strain Y486) TaxID=1055687 RepID=G0TSH2_TRYVY|nr:hypothetical protein TRVL_03740 [Trypanosoma vivax]CCC46899.1 hypothetical protein TVY486_0300910 [Trypanosoma vivax Y486]
MIKLPLRLEEESVSEQVWSDYRGSAFSFRSPSPLTSPLLLGVYVLRWVAPLQPQALQYEFPLSSATRVPVWASIFAVLGHAKEGRFVPSRATTRLACFTHIRNGTSLLFFNFYFCRINQ